MRILALLLLCGCAWQAAAAEIYQWTDENGKRHFGESIPERYKKSGGPMTLTPANVMPSNATPANTGAASPGSAATTLPASPEPKASATQTERDRCHEAMRRYQESVACFESYRNHNGSLKPGATEHCQSMAQPTGCTNN